MEQLRAQVLVIDDDLLIRELIGLLLSRNGYEVYEAASGEAALAMLGDQNHPRPLVVLADMQLPGIAGTTLARHLRALLGKGPRIIAISGDQPQKADLEGFDDFVRKPFTEEALKDVLQANVPSSELGDGESRGASPLNEAVYDRLARSMSQEQLTKLYQLCLDDCRRRMDAIREAASQNNMDACSKEAHTIRGSCGMVGATEIASLGGYIESHSLVANLEGSLKEMMLACGRLEDQLRVRGLCIQRGNR